MIDSLGYKDSIRFRNEYFNVTYPEFDYYAVHSLNLFSSFEDINLAEIEKEVGQIERILPSMKRIFSKPIIHLIDVEEIVSVEAVKKISPRTITYASTHSELWDDITEDGIKPLKLLTENNKDNYAIYENLVFVKAVDYALNFARRYSRILKDMVYTNKKLEIDLLERENHMSYYLALGKLETGHIRSFSKYVDTALNLISRLDFIDKVLSARLHRPVYVNCKKKVKGKLKLRKTNILSMQKDYRNIYRFLKSIYKDDVIENKEDAENELGYSYFCKYLLIFSIGHFNFSMNKNKRIDFDKLNLTFDFKKYKLKVKDVVVNDKKVIELTFKNGLEYKMYLLPSLKGKDKLDSDIETHILSDDFDTKETFISINNIDSFRRLQQLLLKGMIYSTEKFSICPFCGNKLVKKGDGYQCAQCRQEINLETCPETNEPYYVTSISNYVLKENDEEKKEGLLMNRTFESLLHYRNITEVTGDLDFVCPHCHKVHKEIIKE